MGEESVKKSRDKRRQANAVSSPRVVCQAKSPDSNNVELGLLISFMIIALYVFGLYASVNSVPDVGAQSALKAKSTYKHLGENFNVARSEFNVIGGGAGKPHETSRELGKGVGVLNMPYGVPDDEIVIPEHKWPVTVRDEVDDYEELVHSGDGKTVMMVPKFWSNPVHNYKLMSRETAMKIGSCAEPDADGNIARGEACPLDQRTIYVGIASYRDFECRTTVESIFLRAKNPHRIRIGK